MATSQAQAAPMPQADVPVTMQGIVVPGATVDPKTFFRRTRRLTFITKTFNAAGYGLTDNVPVLATGILAGFHIRVAGSITVTLGGGTAATTARWPYDLIKRLQLSANGQSNLINVSGWKLKARDIMARGDLNDRGVSQAIGGASPGTARTQGTLALTNEAWGLGQNVSAVAGAPSTYTFDLEYYVPVAFDQKTLLGAIFAQSSATDLNIQINWASQSDLFVLTGAATTVLNATAVFVEAVAFSIPQGPNGTIIVPDLSMFHQMVETRFPGPVNGDNDVRFVGQGIGRQLLRFWYQVWNGTVSAPLAVNATNFGPQSWLYGGSDQPELLGDGQQLAYWNERLFNSALGLFAGFGIWDFASENAFRDAIDMGAATELRARINIANGVALVSPFIEYVMETAFVGAVGA